jgi:hypothetical protein
MEKLSQETNIKTIKIPPFLEQVASVFKKNIIYLMKSYEESKESALMGTAIATLKVIKVLQRHRNRI